MNISKLSIIVPVYNEEKTIAKILSQLKALRLGKTEKEIIVVDDGSTDGTKKALKTHSFCCKIVSHPKNMGKGAAIRTGLGYATGDYMIIQDADLEYAPRDIKKLISCAETNRALVVYGSRFLRAKIKVPGDFYKGGFLLGVLTNILYGTRITDEATCYKLFNTDLLRRLNLKSNGFDFCPEATAKICKSGIKIYEVPISYRPRDKTEGKKLRFFPEAPKALWVLLSQRFQKEENSDFNLLDKLIRRQRVKQISSYLPKKNNLSWCDIGCGSDAYFLRKLQGKIKEGVGIDPLVNCPSLGDITFIKEKIIKKIPLTAKSFDVVTLLALLEHLDFPEAVLKEVWRILKKDGLLIITTPSPRAKIVLETLSRLEIISRREIKEHKHYFSINELLGMFQKVGFEKNEITLKEFQLGLNIVVSAKKG